MKVCLFVCLGCVLSVCCCSACLCWLPSSQTPTDNNERRPRCRCFCDRLLIYCGVTRCGGLERHKQNSQITFRRCTCAAFSTTVWTKFWKDQTWAAMMRQCLVIFCTPSNALRSIACSEEEDQFSSVQPSYLSWSWCLVLFWVLILLGWLTGWRQQLAKFNWQL